MAQWGDRLGIEFFNVEDVLWANRGYGLGCTGAGDSSAEVRWFVEVGGINEGKTVIPVIKDMRGRL